MIIQKELEKSSGLKLKLKITDNRSTMLSVKWEPKLAEVSIHRMFLDAPQNIMDSLACYLRKKEKLIPPSITMFIEKNLKTFDYSHRLKAGDICVQGDVYNLQEIYDRLNNQYFENQIKLAITWFGKSIGHSKSRVTFGLYCTALRLIKINRLLDSASLPDYVISYVVYHEMLHHVCPSYFGKNGVYAIHTKEFKAREKLFHHYTLAQNWIRDNKINFFL